MVNLKVIVTGAEVEGLATAVALHRNGHDPVVVDTGSGTSHPGPEAVVLGPYAADAWGRLGLGDDLASIGSRISAHEHLDSRGRRRGTYRVGRLAAMVGASSVSVRRDDLVRQFTRYLPEDCIRRDVIVTGFDRDASGIRLNLGDRTALDGDLLVGTDGAGSVIRRELHGRSATASHGVMWSGITEGYRAALPPATVRHWWGRSTRIDVIPVGPEDLAWRVIASPTVGSVEEAIAGFGALPRSVVSSTPRREVSAEAIIQPPALRHWGRGLVTLLGTAAHPMSDVTTQSTSQGIEDAVCLARCLSAAARPTEGLRTYESLRIRRTSAAVRESTVTVAAIIRPSGALRTLRDRLALPAAMAARSWGPAQNRLVPIV